MFIHDTWSTCIYSFIRSQIVHVDLVSLMFLSAARTGVRSTTSVGVYPSQVPSVGAKMVQIYFNPDVFLKTSPRAPPVLRHFISGWGSKARKFGYEWWGEHWIRNIPELPAETRYRDFDLAIYPKATSPWWCLTIFYTTILVHILWVGSYRLASIPSL